MFRKLSHRSEPRSDHKIAACFAYPQVKQGDKVQIEVIGIEGKTFKLRIFETAQEDFLFESEYIPWTLGTRKRVRVAATTAAGLVKKIVP